MSESRCYRCVLDFPDDDSTCGCCEELRAVEKRIRELEANVRNQRHELRRLSEQRPPGNHGAHDCCEHQTEAREMRMNVAHVCETLADDGWVRVDYVLTATDMDGGGS